MAKVLLNLKTDREIKERAKKIAAELGIPLSTVINAYLKEFIRERAVHIVLEPQPRPEVIKLLEKASNDYRKRKNVSKRFSTPSEALRYLHS